MYAFIMHICLVTRTRQKFIVVLVGEIVHVPTVHVPIVHRLLGA